MDKIRMRRIITIFSLLVVLTGCTLPGFSTPTPFSFPTPDKTMTALFEPTQAAPATSASDASTSDSDAAQETVNPPDLPTSTSTPNAAETEAAAAETETAEPTDTDEPDVSYAGPAVRSGPSIEADYMSGVGIDGDLAGWKPPIQKVIKKVVFGADKYSGELDCSGTVVAGWNEDYLFLGVRAKDDKYVQEAAKEKIYLGDSIEILFDRYVSADYYLQAMTADDYQIGISPGRGGIEGCVVINGKVAVACDPHPPEAYMWFPKAQAGQITEMKIGALEGSEGYQVEMRIPWSLLGVTNPKAGDHFGFAISISDNDKTDTKTQQTVVSNVGTRYFADPTTWGDLVLMPK